MQKQKDVSDMPKKREVKDIDELERKYLRGEKGQEFRALMVKPVEELGTVNDLSKPTDIPERTIYDWL